MTREDHLCYCCVCTKRQFTHDLGFVCNLTGRVADFDPTCNMFELDREEKNKRNEAIRNEITESLERQKALFKKIFDDKPAAFFLTDHDVLTSLGSLGKEAVIMEGRNMKADLIYPVLFVLGALVYSGLRKGWEQFQTYWEVPAMVMLFALPLLYFYFRQRELFRIGKEGVIVDKKEFIPWHNIRYISFVKNKGKSQYLSCVFHLEFGINKVVDIHHATKDQQELGRLLYESLKRWKKN